MPNVQPASAVYRALDASRNEIRLLMVQPRQDGLPTAPVRCSLRYTFLSEDDRLEYEAVSYCWGDSDTEASIWLDEIELSVPESAAEVLKHFQPTERPRLLWIDAVCINLKDPEERSSQVAMMASIYGQCVQTIAYLRGPTQHDHAAALQLEEILAKVRALGGTEGLRANEADPYQAHDESIAQAYSHLVAVLACRWFRCVRPALHFVIQAADCPKSTVDSAGSLLASSMLGILRHSEPCPSGLVSSGSLVLPPYRHG